MERALTSSRQGQRIRPLQIDIDNVPVSVGLHAPDVGLGPSLARSLSEAVDKNDIVALRLEFVQPGVAHKDRTMRRKAERALVLMGMAGPQAIRVQEE